MLHLFLITARPGVYDHPQFMEEETVTLIVEITLAKSSTVVPSPLTLELSSVKPQQGL